MKTFARINNLGRIMKTLSCREAGFECDYVVKGGDKGRDLGEWS
jgi:hypothetical protein